MTQCQTYLVNIKLHVHKVSCLQQLLIHLLINLYLTCTRVCAYPAVLEECTDWYRSSRHQHSTLLDAACMGLPWGVE